MNNFVSASKYCTNIFDGTHDTPKQVKVGRPLVTSKNILGGKLDLENTYNISESDYNAIQRRSSVSQWDILFSMIGSVGEVYLEQSDKIVYAIKNVGVFSCNDEYLAKWLYIYFRSPYAKKFIDNYLTGAVQKFLGLGVLRDFPVPIYDDANSSIVDLYFSLEKKISVNSQIIHEVESLMLLHYNFWFMQFDFPEKSGKSYRDSGGKFIYSKELNRKIPISWSVESVSKSCEIVDCLHSKKPEVIIENEDHFLMQLENIEEDGTVDTKYKYYVSSEDYAKWTSRIEVKENDLVVTNAGRIGAIAQLAKGQRMGIGRNITAVRPKSVAPTYLYLAFTGIDITRQIKSNTDSGAFFGSLNVKGIKKLYILRPDEDTEKKFEQLVRPMRDLKAILKQENTELEKLRDWLLPLLMNGQVKIEI